MPDILQTADHYKHSRKWTLTGRWGEECIACLVFLLDDSRTPITKRKSLLGEINHLLRSSDELVQMLSACDLSRRLGKVLVSALCATLDERAVESVNLLEQVIKCTHHDHSVLLMEEVARRFYEHSNNHKVAGLLGTCLSQLISNNAALRSEIVRNKMVDNLCDTLRPSSEQIQNVILSFLLHLHSYSPLQQVISELRLVKLAHNSIKLLASSVTVSKAMFLIHAIISNESFAEKHKTSLINQGNLMQGMKHALAYAKSPEVVSRALSLLRMMNTPQLITQHNLLDYILECLSSEDEGVCVAALDLCISSHQGSRGSLAYVSDSLVNLVLRESKRMRGEIIERCLVFLLKLKELRVSEELGPVLVSLLQWGNDSLVSLVCLTIHKFHVQFTTVQAMKTTVELVKWMSGNLSARTRRLPTPIWLPGASNTCKEGEQVLGVVLAALHHLMKGIISSLSELEETVLRDLVILCDQHCIPPVFSLETVELCPHVYKHVFSIVSLILATCYEKQGRKLLEQEGTIKTFALKIFRLTRDSFLLRTTLCSAFAHPDVLSTLHNFTATTSCIFLSLLVPFPPSLDSLLHKTLLAGLELLPFISLERALGDALRTTERPSYHTELASQSSFCAQVSCLVLVLLKLSPGPPGMGVVSLDQLDESMDKGQLRGCVKQLVNLYGTHRLLPSFFLPLTLALYTRLGGTQTQGLCHALTAQQQSSGVQWGQCEETSLHFVIEIEGMGEDVVGKCGLEMVKRLKNQPDESTSSISDRVKVTLMKVLIAQDEIPDNLSVVSSLVSSCTDNKVLGSLVADLTSNITLDISSYSATLAILTTAATSHPTPPNTRTILSVLQCVLCGSNDLAVSLRFLYVMYVTNPRFLGELLVNRYDVLACLCSFIKEGCGFVEPALLLLCEHVSRYPGCEGVTLDMQSFVELIESATSPVTIAALWRLARHPSLHQYKRGFAFLALRSLVQPEHLSSMHAAKFIIASDCASSPWVNIAVQTSLLLDKLPSGVILILASHDEETLGSLVATRAKFMLSCLVRQFGSEQQLVIMKLLARLTQVYPDEAARYVAKCVTNEGVSRIEWQRRSSGLVNTRTLEGFSETQAAEIRADFGTLLNHSRSLQAFSGG